MDLKKHFTRVAAAALFAATTSTAVVVTDATHAGAPAQGIAASAPQAADAAVVAVGVGFGPYRYYRWGYRGGAWTRLGFYYGSAPGYIPGGYYVGYGPPGGYYGRPYGGGYWGHPYWGHSYWGHPYWHGGYWGHGYWHGGGYWRR